jgi:hypothetical protein
MYTLQARWMMARATGAVTETEVCREALVRRAPVCSLRAPVVAGARATLMYCVRAFFLQPCSCRHGSTDVAGESSGTRGDPPQTSASGDAALQPVGDIDLLSTAMPR